MGEQSGEGVTRTDGDLNTKSDPMKNYIQCASFSAKEEEISRMSLYLLGDKCTSKVISVGIK